MNTQTTPKRTRADITADLKKAREELAHARDALAKDEAKDWSAEAQAVVDKMFKQFPDLRAYLDRVAARVVKTGYVMSPIGRRRVMFRALLPNNKFHADAQRRAKNAPIQGIGSEVGVTAAYLVLQHMDEYQRTFDDHDLHGYLYQRAVHDANYNWSRYDLVLPALLINLWCATYGVTAYFEQVFGLRFLIEPEIEYDIGASGDAMETWDFRISELPNIINKGLDSMVMLKRLSPEDRDAAFAAVFEPLVNAQKREYLLDRYPLLGLHPSTPEGQNVTDRIFEMLRSIKMEPES